MNRALVCGWVMFLLGSSAGADEPKRGTEKEEVVLKINVPKTVDFKATKIPGGGTGSFKVEVVVDNKSKEGVALSRHKLEFDVLDDKGLSVGEMFWNWDKPEKGVADAFLLPAGQSHKFKEEIRFHTWVPDDGKKFSLVLKAFEKDAKGEFEAKNKK